MAAWNESRCRRFEPLLALNALADIGGCGLMGGCRRRLDKCHEIIAAWFPVVQSCPVQSCRLAMLAFSDRRIRDDRAWESLAADRSAASKRFLRRHRRSEFLRARLRPVDRRGRNDRRKGGAAPAAVAAEAGRPEAACV